MKELRYSTNMSPFETLERIKNIKENKQNICIQAGIEIKGIYGSYKFIVRNARTSVLWKLSIAENGDIVLKDTLGFGDIALIITLGLTDIMFAIICFMDGIIYSDICAISFLILFEIAASKLRFKSFTRKRLDIFIKENIITG